MKKGRIKSLKELGLPFYYGETVFSFEAKLPKTDREFVNIGLDTNWLTDSVRLETEGYETEPVAWQPYIFKVPAELINDTKQVVKLKLKNTALGLFEGTEFCREEHAYIDI